MIPKTDKNIRKQGEGKRMNHKIEELADAAAEKAVKAFFREMKKEESKKVLHNTWVLMDKYIEMKKHVDRAISDDDGVCLFSVRKSKTKTALMIENIDRAIAELRVEKTESGESYKFDAFEMRFLQGKTYEQICDVLDCGKNSPARWCKEMTAILSVKLFGVDGIDKW